MATTEAASAGLTGGPQSPLRREKPMPIEPDLVLRRLVEMAGADAGLRERRPRGAACYRTA